MRGHEKGKVSKRNAEKEKSCAKGEGEKEKTESQINTTMCKENLYKCKIYLTECRDDDMMKLQ